MSEHLMGDPLYQPPKVLKSRFDEEKRKCENMENTIRELEGTIKDLRDKNRKLRKKNGN